MADLLYTELLKLKRSSMFLLSLIGSALAPLMVVLSSYISMRTHSPDEARILFTDLFFDSNLYLSVLIGAPLYGVVTAYLFNREYAEDTLKNLLTIPVPRTRLLLSKLLLLFFWIMLLAVVAWGLTLVLGSLLGFEGLSGTLVWTALGQFAAMGALMFALSAPVVFTSLLLKNYVPTIVLTIVITLINVMVSNSEYKGLVPWTAVFDLVYGQVLPKFPVSYSLFAIGITSLGGFAASLIYFRKADIH